MAIKLFNPPLRLPWKNSWFQVAVLCAIFSACLLISDAMAGHGLPLPRIDLPMFAKPGSLMVNSETPGVSIHIDGQDDQPAPANFPQLSVGFHNVVASAPGYESMTQRVEIKEAQASTMDVTLNRAYGSASLQTVPSHVDYQLVGTADDNRKVYQGTTPANLVSLPVGTYQLTLNGSDADSHPINVEIAARQTTYEVIDLVKAGLAQETNPAVSKVLLGQSPLSSLSDEDKKDYVGLMNRAFAQYIRSKMFNLATSDINTLKAAGVDTQAQEKQLAEARESYEEEINDQIKPLVADGKFGEVRYKLAMAMASAPPDMADKIGAEFQPQIDAYEQQANDAVQASASGDPAAAFTTLKSFADQHPDDVHLQMALGQLLTRMPPDHNRLSAQVSALKSFDREILDADQISDLDALQNKLQTELTTYDKLLGQLNDAKEGAGPGATGRIATLERRIKADQAIIAAGGGVNGFLHIRVVDLSEKQAEIDDAEAKITEIETAQKNSQSTLASAQRQFASFCATVPW